MGAMLEHVNITVSNPARTAQMLCDLFGWRVRWNGPAKSGGTTFHVGDDDAYLAVYTPAPGSVLGDFDDMRRNSTREQARRRPSRASLPGGERRRRVGPKTAGDFSPNDTHGL